MENRPVSITGGASFIYDGDGNRVKKTENGETILYINKYYEKNLTTSVVTVNYFLGDKLVAIKAGDTLRYVHQDHLTGTSLMSTSGGALDSSITYLPYGTTRAGSVNTDKKFTGQRLDGTGLYYYGARYYDPVIGRFISADVFLQDISNPQALNRYSYVLNNPLRYTDPSGWWTFGLGINFTGTFLAWVLSGSVMIVTSGHGELGVVWSGGGGGGGASTIGAASLTLQGQLTSADSIGDLRGVAVQAGGSGGAIWGGGLEWTGGKGYQGVNVQGGLAGGFEMHGIAEKAGVKVFPVQMPWGDTSQETSLPSTKSAPISTDPPKPATPSNIAAQSTLSGFTASLAQLNSLGSPVGSTSYQQAVDTAYNAVASTLGSGQMMAWSSSQGYYAVDTSSYDYISWDYWY